MLGWLLGAHGWGLYHRGAAMLQLVVSVRDWQPYRLTPPAGLLTLHNPYDNPDNLCH